jgi:cytochrome c peroxidase
LTSNVPSNVTIEDFCGKFRMVSLRNTAEKNAFMHNGFFKNLREVVSFYATRNSNPQRWYGPAGVPNDLPNAYLRNIVNDRVPFNKPASAGPALSEREIDDVVAFLKTLSDAPPPGPRTPAQPGALINPFGSP